MTNENSPYYLGNNECKPTTLTVKTTDRVIKQELPWDVNAKDLIHAMVTAMVGMTFSEDMVWRVMYEMASEHYNTTTKK